MTERADQLHHYNGPAYSTALVEAFLAKHHITRVSQPHCSPDLAACDLKAFPEAKITVEREEICASDGHTLRKHSHWRLTAN